MINLQEVRIGVYQPFDGVIEMDNTHENFDAAIEAASKLSYEEKGELVALLTKMMQESELSQPKKRKSLLGVWKDSPPITEEDIREIREEMWGNFPREDIA